MITPLTAVVVLAALLFTLFVFGTLGGIVVRYNHQRFVERRQSRGASVV